MFEEDVLRLALKADAVDCVFRPNDETRVRHLHNGLFYTAAPRAICG